MAVAKKNYIVQIEGNHASGVSSVIKGIYEQQRQRSIIPYKLKTLYEPLDSIIHSAIGNLQWHSHQNSNDKMATCIMEMSAYFSQRCKLADNADCDVIVMERSLSLLRHVFQMSLAVRGELDLLESLSLQTLYASMAQLLPKPDLVIMLECPLEEQRRRLDKRNMSRDWLILHINIIDTDEL